MNIIEVALEFVKRDLSGNDASHDFHHIQRVHKLALTIARNENVEDTEVIELGAILHDVQDYKYSGNDSDGYKAVERFLKDRNYPQDKIERIVAIMKGVSFRNELENPNQKLPLEIAIVQDADRLDGIGAIGVARAFTFGGMKKNKMHDETITYRENMTKHDYMHGTKENTTINHFYEKLLKIKDMLKTKSGKELAQRRHEFMEHFLLEFLKDWNCQ